MPRKIASTSTKDSFDHKFVSQHKPAIVSVGGFFVANFCKAWYLHPSSIFRLSHMQQYSVLFFLGPQHWACRLAISTRFIFGLQFWAGLRNQATEGSLRLCFKSKSVLNMLFPPPLIVPFPSKNTMFCIDVEFEVPHVEV